MRDTIARLGTLDETTLTRDTRGGLIAAFRNWRT
jgi:hypothetical protein